MSNETLEYIPSIAIRNYGLVFILFAIVFFFGKYQGTPNGILVLKLAVVPLIFLAPRGLRSIYRQPIIEHKITARGLEYIILSALIISLTVFVILWAPELAASELLKNFLMVFIPLLSCMMIFMAVDIRRNKRNIENA